MIEVTPKEFRDKQAGILELADRGERVIIKRRKKPAYTLVPVDDDAAYFTPEMLEKIDRSMKQAEAGDVKRISSIEEIDRFLGLRFTNWNTLRRLKKTSDSCRNRGKKQP